MNLAIILLVILIFGLIVFVHELGHFLAARRSGVEVEEFGFGFPPRIFGRKVGRTLYSINLIPLGGFVRLKGEDSADKAKGSFGAASFRNKSKILLAGVGMNALTAYVIFLFLAATGLPPVLADQFSFGTPTYAQPPRVMAVAVDPGSPADKAGIKRGDLIVQADGRTLTTEDELINFTRKHAGQKVQLTVQHKSTAKELNVQLLPLSASSGFLGVTPFQTFKLKYDILHAPVVAAGILGQLMWATLAAFGGLISGLVVHHKVSDQVTGPVGIVVLLSDIADLGTGYIFIFIASISVSLAVINALPLPSLDGGRWAIAFAQRITKRQLSARAESIIHGVGFAALILLMLVVTFFDIKRFG
jgi:regulator of sigma E protease